MAQEMPKVQVKNLTKKFGDLLVLDNISFDVPKGEFLCIVGPTGCGKTTFLNSLTKLYKPTAGEILLDGEPVDLKKHNVAYIFQEYSTMPWLTVEENVGFGLDIKGVEKTKAKALVDEYLDIVGLTKYRHYYPDQLSASMLQRVVIARAFATQPDLLLMDGGRGQVSAAKAALAGTSLADVPLYGMVKDDHHRTRAIVDSEGREIAINMNRGTFTFITAIQDETHRFANAYRKQQMRKKSYSSTLTEVPGVGPKTAKALMTQFKSVGAVREATPDQLENTPGVGPQLAQTIYDYFHA